MGYKSGCHTTFHHRYHLVWAPKYRFKVLHGEVRLGMTMPAALPSAGQIAPKIHAEDRR
jgi:REP element-mobilizing transposase RayT